MRAVGYYNPQPCDAAPEHSGHEDPLAAIKRFCAEEFHQLVAVVPPEGALQASGARYGYSDLVEVFTGPDSRPALVVIPDSAHLAADLEQLVRRVIEIEAIGGTIRCADVDAPDPLQDGLSRLALPGRTPGRQRRIRDAILSKAVRGEALGRLPFGYLAGVDGMPAPVPDEAEIVARIFDWYLGEPLNNLSRPAAPADESPEDVLGDGSGGIGFRRIAARLNEQGVSTRSGNRWSPVAVAGLLRNRAYIGTYSRQGIRLVANHPPLVDRAVFNRAQEILRARRPHRRPPKSSRFRLRGLLRCAQCGSGVHGITRARRWTRADGTEVAREYLYYECPARPARSDQQMNHASWRAEELETAVMVELEKLGLAVVTSSSSSAIAITGEDPASAQLRALQREFMRRYRLVASGHGRVQTLEPLLDEIERVRGGGPPAGSEAAESYSDRDELMRRAAGDDIEEARRALRAMIARLDIGASEIELTPRE
ncbi:MAG: recombinase family protein [Chloroflexi bacterium]|nr:recombinase family protein [Chloroflexota bacterium]